MAATKPVANVRWSIIMITVASDDFYISEANSVL
jgi:hypothetical protein